MWRWGGFGVLSRIRRRSALRPNMTHTDRNLNATSVVASTPVLLSTEPSDVQWPHALVSQATLMFRTQSSSDGEWSTWSPCPPRRSLFGSARTLARLPATHIDGRLEVRPFLRPREFVDGDEGDSGNTLEPAGGTMFFILFSDPVVVEEAMMFLDETSKVPDRGGGRRRAAVSGATGRAGAFWSLFSFERGRHGARDAASETSRDARRAGVASEGGGRRLSARLAARRDGEGAAPRAPNDPESRDHSGHAAEWDAELKRVARLMFDDTCDVETMRGGCEDAAASGLLHLLRRFGNKAIAETREARFNLTALELSLIHI